MKGTKNGQKDKFKVQGSICKFLIVDFDHKVLIEDTESIGFNGSQNLEIAQEKDAIERQMKV